MKKVLVLIAVFAAGVFCGALVLRLIIGNGPAWVYSDALAARADLALKVRLGEQETFLRDFEATLPDYVDGARSFGDHDFVQNALWKVRAYYETTGTPIPASIAPALAGLPPRQQSPSARRADKEKTSRTKIGDAAPLLSLHSIDGEDIDLKGKVVVLNFFATWCGPCMAEMPHLEKDIWEPLRAKGVIVAGIGRDHSEAELKVFRDQKHFSFPLVADPKHEIYERFATAYIPRCVLIAKDGRINYQSVGFIIEDFRDLVKAVESEIAR